MSGEMQSKKFCKGYENASEQSAKDGTKWGALFMANKGEAKGKKVG